MSSCGLLYLLHLILLPILVVVVVVVVETEGNRALPLSTYVGARTIMGVR
jgi:hypothetical protein